MASRSDLDTPNVDVMVAKPHHHVRHGRSEVFGEQTDPDRPELTVTQRWRVIPDVGKRLLLINRMGPHVLLDNFLDGQLRAKRGVLQRLQLRRVRRLATLDLGHQQAPIRVKEQDIKPISNDLLLALPAIKLARDQQEVGLDDLRLLDDPRLKVASLPKPKRSQLHSLQRLRAPSRRINPKGELTNTSPRKRRHPASL